MSEVTAEQAMVRAEAAHAKIESHEDLCAERYSNIHTSLSELKKLVAWGGGTVFTLLIAVLGFLGARAITSNDAQVDRMQNQIEQMQHVKQTPAVLRVG